MMHSGDTAKSKVVINHKLKGLYMHTVLFAVLTNVYSLEGVVVLKHNIYFVP